MHRVRTDGNTYWQVARAVVAAEPRATDATATKAMVVAGVKQKRIAGEMGSELRGRRRGNRCASSSSASHLRETNT